MGLPASKDQLFLDEATQPFTFSKEVALVFDDMVRRSIPFYHEVVTCAVKVASDYYQPGTVLYDIGCSTGNTILAILDKSGLSNIEIEAIDPSSAMLEQFSKKLVGHPRASEISLRHKQIEESVLKPSSVVILNYTLQFIAPPLRSGVLNKIYSALTPGGVLFFSEKTSVPNESVLFDSLYYDFKRRNGYSWDEIENKRQALAGVLRPLTANQNLDLLKQAGFGRIIQVFQGYQFVTFLCFA